MTIKRVVAAATLAVMLLCASKARSKESVTELVHQQPEPYRQVLSREIQWLTSVVSAPRRLETYEPSAITVRALKPSHDILKMFPRHRFYAVKYTNNARSDMPPSFPVRRATIGDVDYLYIIGPSGKHYKTLQIGAKDDHFVKLLQDNHVTISSKANVRRIWNLYLDLEEMPNPDKYANIPGYKKGRERLRNIPIRQTAKKQWDIEQGINRFQVQVEIANRRKATLRNTIYRLSLGANNTIMSIKEIEKPVITTSL